MSIFNFFDKKQGKQTATNIIRTTAVNKALNPDRYDDEKNNSKIRDKKSENSNDVIKNKNLDNDKNENIDFLDNVEIIDDLKNNDIDLNLDDNLSEINKKSDLKNDFNKSINLNNLNTLNKDFDKFQESLSNDFDNMLKNGEITKEINNILKDDLVKTKEVKKDTEIKLPVVEVKKDTKAEEKKKTVSEIAFLAMSRPANVAFDLGDDVYVDEGCEVVKFDIYGTQADLKKFVEEHLDIKYLDISDCREDLDFSILSKLKKLKHLDLSGNRNLEDISFLNGMNDLIILNIGITAITTLHNFPYLPKLRVLNLKMNHIKNLQGLEKQTDLTDIVLWGSDIDDIEILKNFKNLRALDFDNCSNIKDFSSISNLTKLIYLDFLNLKMSEFSFLKKLKNLVCLLMDGISGIMSDKKLDDLKNLTNMKFLYMKNMNLRDISFLKNMTKMCYLDLTGNFIVDLSPLENMTEITNLVLSNNLSLTDLSPLHKMSKMKKLKISGLSGVKNDNGLTATSMIITDISVVKNMPDLKVIESNNNSKIRDITPLKYCSKLEEAHFNNCMSITDASALMYCRQLTDIYFNKDIQLKDFSFVKYLTKLRIMEIKMSGVDALTISNFTNMPVINVWSVDTTSITNSKFKPNSTSAKGRKTINNGLKSYIKPEDYKND